MITGCIYCSRGVEVLMDLEVSLVCLPARPHIAPEDGGHLIVVPTRHLPNRLSLRPPELLAVTYGTILAARALEHVYGTAWFNFQENGNWSVRNLASAHAHEHVYGRAPHSVAQPFGEALRFPDSRDVEGWHVLGPDPTQAERLRRSLAELRLTGWAQQFELALVGASVYEK